MRKKPLLLVAFLMMSLCMIPSVTAGYGDESPQSITSFSETLPDDVLFYPDLGINGTKVFASDGEGWPDESGFLSNTYIDNIDNLGGYDTTSPTVANVTLDFDDIQSEAEGIFYYFNLYVHPSNDDADFWIWNYVLDDWEILISNVPTGPAYYSDSIYSTDYFAGGMGGNVLFLFNGTTTGATVGCYIQYAYLNSLIMTLADSDHYAESFTDVTDWTVHVGNTITTDDDVGSFHVPADNAYDYYYTDSPSITNVNGYYLEIRHKTNLTNDWNFVFTIKGFTGDARSGTYYDLVAGNHYSDDEWQTEQFHLSANYTLECLEIMMKRTAGDDTTFDIDYLRISPANESGWQHDGSTTSGVSDDSVADMTYEYATDGDILNMTATNTLGSSQYSWFYLAFDTTTTAADLENLYYPFFAANLKVSISNAGATSYGVRPNYGDKLVSLVPTRDGADYETIRGNVAAGSVAYVSYVAFYCYLVSGGSVIWLVDWAKAYSIANFTVTQSSVTTDDYLYVDSGVLYSSIDDGYIEANHDPALNISHYQWNMNTSAGTPEVDFYDGAWLGYSSEIEGEFLIGTTVTDFRLRFTDNADIISLKFTDRTGWNIVNTVVVIFNMALFTGSLDALLIFLGLIMIPASTLYFVKGGRSEMSGNKVYYCLIAFTIGWALFLGGIYG